MPRPLPVGLAGRISRPPFRSPDFWPRARVGVYNVRKSLEAVPGVSKAVVSYKDKTAVVTYDDGRTDVSALTRATTDAGYPSAPRS